MKIANRLRFSFWMMIAAIVVTGALATVMMVRTGSAAGVNSEAEQQIALGDVGDLARGYGAAAMNIALGIERVTNLDEFKVLGAHLRASGDRAAQLAPHAAKDLPAVLVEYTSGTEAAVGKVIETAMGVRSAAINSFRGTKRAAPPPPPSRGRGPRAAPPPEETEVAAAPAPELIEAKIQLLMGAAGKEAVDQLSASYGELQAKLTEMRRAPPVMAAERAKQVQRRTVIFVVVLLAFMVVAGFGVVFMFAGFRTQVLRPLEALATGARRVSAERDLTVAVPTHGDDEIQDVGRAFGEMMETLRGITVEMRGATDRLLSSANELGGITRVQGESIARQASALEEARRTSTTLRQSSRQAAGQAEGVLRVAQKAEELGRSGETALTESLSSAAVIQGQTLQVVERIARLATSAQRIAAITGTVKDLADQSNVVALNAAIEASRAGEFGVGFGVVAREIRSLADRSIRATVDVRTVLAEVLAGIRESAALVEAAHSGLEEGSTRTRRLGESVAGLTGIVRENLGAVREISQAVTEQGTGIGQISSAVEDLSLMMEETLRTVQTTGEAAGVLREVSQQVSSSVKVFRL